MKKYKGVEKQRSGKLMLEAPGMVKVKLLIWPSNATLAGKKYDLVLTNSPRRKHPGGRFHGTIFILFGITIKNHLGQAPPVAKI